LCTIRLTGVSAERTRVVVVGGGIAGLTAAYRLAEDPAYDVTVLEASPSVGGKLRLDEVGGVRIDVGAESILNRRPEGVALARELGLPVVHPATISAALWSEGELRPMPRTIMGVPLDVDELAQAHVLTARVGSPCECAERDSVEVEADLARLGHPRRLLGRPRSSGRPQCTNTAREGREEVDGHEPSLLRRPN